VAYLARSDAGGFLHLFTTRTMLKSRDVRRFVWHRRRHQQHCRPGTLETRITCLQM